MTISKHMTDVITELQTTAFWKSIDICGRKP